MSEPAAAVAGAIESELRFLDPAVYASPSRLLELLDPDFRAWGSSGRTWDRESLITELRSRGATATRPVTVSRMRGVELAPGVVHLTFDADSNGYLAHRSSVWRLAEGAWRLYFHQSTRFNSVETAG